MNLKQLSTNVPVSVIMQHVVDDVTKLLQQLLNLDIKLDPLQLKPPPVKVGEATGDIAVPCFPYAKQLGMSPQDIAKKIETDFASFGILESVQALGPFCNVTIDRKQAVAILLKEIQAQGDHFGASSVGKDKRVMIEYSSPNTNKPQHLGHVRNNLIGHVCANLLNAVGFYVVKTSIVNDRGIHICKSMLAYQEWGEGKTPESEGIKSDHFVGQFYVLFENKLKEERQDYFDAMGMSLDELEGVERTDAENEFMKSSSLMRQAQEMLQAWENNDSEVVALWKKMNQWVYDGFEETYRELGVDFDHTYYESELYTQGRDIITKALEEGKLVKRDDGAIVAELSKYGKLPDKVVLRSDGTSIYITQDMALAKKKFEDYNLDYSMYCIASEQDTYVAQVIATLKLMGFSFADAMYHLSYGMVELPEGKMKSREGTVVDADNLIKEMRDLAKSKLIERTPDMSADELEKRSKAIGDGALKYFIHSSGRKAKILFDPNKSISFEGATGPYLQYAFTRIASIFRNPELSDSTGFNIPDDFSIEVGDEWQILSLLANFPSEIYRAAIDSEPRVLAKYLFEVGKAFSGYYKTHSVKNSEGEERVLRIALLHAVQQVLKNGLALLDISTIEEM